MPNTLATTVRHGITISNARYFGDTSTSTGSSAMVLNTSTSSVTTIVPISAEKPEPDRPLTVIAVIKGPVSRVTPMATRSTTNSSAPILRSSDPPSNARTSPVQNEVSATIG